MTTKIERSNGWMIRVAMVLLCVCISSGVLKADVTLYGQTVYSGTFGSLDATTGVFTPISGVNPIMAGFGTSGGMLFGVDYYGDGQLYQINAGTGVFNPIGTGTGLTYYDFGSTTTGGLFALDDSANLYSIDPTTGGATFIGATGLGFGGYGTQLSNNLGALYLVDNGNLYTLNMTTATPTLVSAVLNGGPYDALAGYAGTLYGAGYLPAYYPPFSTVDTIDTTTGDITTGPTVSGTGSDLVFSGLAAVPEPGSMIPLGFALAGVASVLWRKRIKHINLT